MDIGKPDQGSWSTAIQVKRIADDPDDQMGESAITIKGPQGRINRVVWGPLNQTIISAGEDSVVCMWDVETGKLLKESEKETGLRKAITLLAKSVDGSHFITGALGKSAKLWDIRMLTLLKTYATERAVNTVTMSLILDHVRNLEPCGKKYLCMKYLEMVGELLQEAEREQMERDPALFQKLVLECIRWTIYYQNYEDNCGDSAA